MRRKVGPVLALATVVASISCGDRAGKPNVVLITLDTTRADHLGCYGYPQDTSPVLDALAADAVRFETAISTTAITPIAHASIFTGTNPYRHGLRVFYGGAGDFLTEDHPTMATLLRRAGWATGAFVSAYPASERYGMHWGFDAFDTGLDAAAMTRDPSQLPPHDGLWQRRRTSFAQRRADATVDQALTWLEDVGKPFFLWSHFFDPHDPSLVPPKSVTDRFGAFGVGPDHAKAVYDPEIFFMDREIGRLLDALRARGDYDDTVIVVVSDHGQGLGDHGWFPHRLLYQEQIRVPLIVRVPGGRRGVTVPDLVRGIDVLPTILEIVGVDPPAGVQGQSLVDLMAGRPEPERLAYAEVLNTLDDLAPDALPQHQKDLLFCTMDRRFKLIHHKLAPENTELYDLESDPGELENVARDRPGEVRRLVAALEESGAMDVVPQPPSEPMSRDAVEKLESLGYTR